MNHNHFENHNIIQILITLGLINDRRLACLTKGTAKLWESNITVWIRSNRVFKINRSLVDKSEILGHHLLLKYRGVDFLDVVAGPFRSGTRLEYAHALGASQPTTLLMGDLLWCPCSQKQVDCPHAETLPGKLYFTTSPSF